MQTALAWSEIDDARACAQDLAQQIRGGLEAAPTAIMLFAAPSLDHETLLHVLADEFDGALIAGSSSAGEFMNQHRGVGLACAIGIRGDDVRFGLSVGRNLAADPVGAAREMATGLTPADKSTGSYRSALLMTDALAGHADVLLDELNLATNGQYQFFGGGAGDNAQFQKTSVFCGREVVTGGAVALEIISDKPVGIGVSHGWEPASRAHRASEVDGMRLVSLDGMPAVEAFESHATELGVSFKRPDPLPFFLHNILGVDTGVGHQLRVPLAVLEDGSILCAAEIPEGSIVRIMRTSQASAVEAADRATQAALAGLGDATPGAALFFDCVATRLRLGDGFGEEIASVRDRLQGADMMGCNTHGQIARAEGQFQGFHNCTAVVCVLPE